MQEIRIDRGTDKLGMIVKGGLHGQPGNPLDEQDEGVFISKINEGSVAEREPRLKVGQRIIEVNGQSLLGATHQEAVTALRNAGESIHIIVCDGFDTEEEAEGGEKAAPAPEVEPKGDGESSSSDEEKEEEETMQEKVRADCVSGVSLRVRVEDGANGSERAHVHTKASDIERLAWILRETRAIHHFQHLSWFGDFFLSFFFFPSTHARR